MDKKAIIKLSVAVVVALAGFFFASNPQVVSALSANQQSIVCFIESVFGDKEASCQ